MFDAVLIAIQLNFVKIFYLEKDEVTERGDHLCKNAMHNTRGILTNEHRHHWNGDYHHFPLVDELTGETPFNLPGRVFAYPSKSCQGPSKVSFFVPSPRGKHVPFTVISNQTIVAEELKWVLIVTNHVQPGSLHFLELLGHEYCTNNSRWAVMSWSSSARV